MRLISFEGIDGCGKSSVISAVNEILRNMSYTTYVAYEPGTFFGKLAKFGGPDLNKEDTVYLWWLARRFEQSLQVFNSVDLVLKDRYYDSTWVYQNLKYSTLESHNFDEKYFIKPEVTIILDVSPEVAIQRMSKSRNIEPKDLYENDSLHIFEERRKGFLEIAEMHKSWRTFFKINTNTMTLNEVIGTSINHILRVIDYRGSFTDFGEEDGKV